MKPPWAVIASVFSMMLVGCTNLPNNPYAPKAEDAGWTRGVAVIAEARLTGSVADPAGTLHLAGNLPTPCHQLRVNIPARPDDKGVLHIDAWSVFDPAKTCAQMLQPFSIQVQVPTAGATGVMVNGENVRREADKL